MRLNRSINRRRLPQGSDRRALLRLEILEDRTLLASLVVGPNVNISKKTGSQAESTISINPTNPLNLFAGSTLGNVNKYSLDGGKTWQNSTYVGLPKTIGDIQSAWDSFGNLFITYLSNTVGTIVARSNDGGATFQDGRTLVSSGTDQPSIAVGPSGLPDVPGAVWVDFTDPSGGVSVAGAPVMGFDAVGAFTTPKEVPGPGGDFGSIAVGPNGEVLVTYQYNGSGIGPDTIKVNLDPNGLASPVFQPYSIATNTNVGGFAPIPAQPDRTIDAEANLAWDRSGGPYNGRLYLVYTDRPSTSSADTDIYVRYSDDDGTTWSDPVRVVDDVFNNGKSQFNPAIAVDQTTGDIAVTWYDTRNSGGANDTAELWGTISEDGGNTYLPNVKISQGISNGHAADSGFDFGDYDLMDFDHGVFYRSWADSSNSTGDNPNGTNGLNIYTAKVAVAGSTNAGVVRGMVWNDRNGDGIREAREVGLPGWTIFVDLHGTGVLQPDDPQAMTGSGGSYFIANVPFGTWNVYEVPQTGWNQTTPPAYTITFDATNLNAGGLNFGNQPANPPLIVQGNLSGSATTIPDSGVATSDASNGATVADPNSTQTASAATGVIGGTDGAFLESYFVPISTTLPRSAFTLQPQAPGTADLGSEEFQNLLPFDAGSP
jgi:hypothetical protein